MTEFVSDIKTISHSSMDVYRVLSDMSKLNLVKDQIPNNKIEGFTFNGDSCSFKVNPIGEVKFDVVERQPNKLVKFKSENLPFDVFLWIQLVSKGEKDTKMRLTVRADLNPFLKPIISQPMKEALDKIADLLTRLPYDSI
ncbi:MAG: SRPBCC family protein [Bacteroidales bacterium]|nr:SRPBCC family protein [Bacteroidales bacterium]